jgi:hypothetical protein
MCHFITAVLPRDAPIEELDAIAQAHGKQFKPLVNRSVESQIKSSEAYFLATAGFCDCGTPLGALSRATPGPDHDRATQEKRLRLRGWGEAKIARALGQKEHHLQVANDAKCKANLEEARTWVNLVASVVKSGKVPFMGLVVHWYSGSLESRVVLNGREVVKSSEFTAETLVRMKEDVLYEFRAEA